jgi:hypothetical protein
LRRGFKQFHPPGAADPSDRLKRGEMLQVSVREILPDCRGEVSPLWLRSVLHRLLPAFLLVAGMAHGVLAAEPELSAVRQQLRGAPAELVVVALRDGTLLAYGAK